LTLRILPRAVRPQIGLAYLLARATDTIADTELVPPAERLEHLRRLRERILGERDAPLDFSQLAGPQESAAERALLEHLEAALALLAACSPEDQRLIRAVLATITSGQELDLQRFGGATEHHVAALQTPGELDDYTYRVAGCVGEFWTCLCRAHLFPGAPLDEASLLAKGVRFGKGLQLINILRDVPGDLRRGRCYLPAQQLAGCGLAPRDLLDSANELKFRPVYDAWLATAEGHLGAGWDYTNALPRRCVRVRLACAWPILIGMKTAALLQTGRVLDPARKLKISRREVRRLMWQSLVRYPWDRAWRRLFPGR
jgi:farnesyl-diphosphate farnesyltransferase